MQNFRLFLASSVTDLHRERMEIGNFIRVLNDRLTDSGADVYFRLGMCEYISDAVADGRKQDVYNSGIRDSGLCVFLFWHRAGEYTLEELNAARTAYRENGSPEVMIFIKDVRDGQPVEPSVGELIHTLGAEGLPCVRFTHIDAVLWQILNKLAENPENGLDPERTEAGVLLNGKPLSEIDPDKLPAEQK